MRQPSTDSGQVLPPDPGDSNADLPQRVPDGDRTRFLHLGKVTCDQVHLKHIHRIYRRFRGTAAPSVIGSTAVRMTMCRIISPDRLLTLPVFQGRLNPLCSRWKSNPQPPGFKPGRSTNWRTAAIIDIHPAHLAVDTRQVGHVLGTDELNPGIEPGTSPIPRVRSGHMS